MASSMLWYDLETFGLDPKHDRIAQFACLRTDEDLREIDEPLKLYCKPSLDYLPSPGACMVHGITPQTAWELGLGEYDFTLRVIREFSRPGTTAVGYNSMHFDEEFIRNLLYRNLFDPYEREYAEGNARWDIINLARAARDLKPEGIVWPRDGEGKPLFKLEALAKANGLDHESAHDALSDIRATIALARLIKSRHPKLYAWYYTHRRRDSLKPLVDLPARRMLLHTASEYSSARGCTTIVAPIIMDSSNRSQLIAIDLRFDPAELLDLSVEQIRERVFAKSEERTEPRIPLSRIRLNHCPFLAPVSALSAEAASRLGLDKDLCERRLAFINANPGIAPKLAQVFDEALPPPPSDDPELCLYSGGFFPDRDKERLKAFHERIARARAGEESLGDVKEAMARTPYIDARIGRLMRRFFARNFPETLGPRERLSWRRYCLSRIQLAPAESSAELSDYTRLLEGDLADPDTPAPRRAIAHALLEWKSHLERELLSWKE
ncbi:MAG TPA: exodeoxyribonuclease I [Rectinemataceae bacterium]